MIHPLEIKQDATPYMDRAINIKASSGNRRYPHATPSIVELTGEETDAECVGRVVPSVGADRHGAIDVDTCGYGNRHYHTETESNQTNLVQYCDPVSAPTNNAESALVGFQHTAGEAASGAEYNVAFDLFLL